MTQLRQSPSGDLSTALEAWRHEQAVVALEHSDEFDVIGDASRKARVADEREGGPVHHPSHYNRHPSGIECIDVIEEMPLNIGTAMKYLWRVGLKESESPDQELAKAAWYIQRERERLRKRAERK